MTTNSSINSNQLLKVTSSPTFSNLTVTTGAVTGYVFTASNGAGLGVWTDISSIVITAISGTPNQISANTVTGTTTLALTNGISLGSYQATSSPAGGILCPGIISSGISSFTADCQLQINTTLALGSRFTGAMISVDGSTNQFVINATNSFAPTNGSNISSVFYTATAFATPAAKTMTLGTSFHASPSFNGNLGTITQIIGFYYDGGQSLSGSVAKQIGGYFAAPIAGTIKIPLYADGISVGTANNGTAPPSNGILTTALNITSLTASTAVVTDSSKNLISLAYSTASSASSLVERDTNQNAFANNFVSKLTNVTAGASTTTLTASSAKYQNLTGSAAQTFQLPDATTLTVGTTFYFNNNTNSSILTVKNGAGTTLFTIPFGGQGFVFLLTNGTTAGTWDVHFSIPSSSSWGLDGLIVNQITISSSAVPGYVLTAISGGGLAAWEDLSTLSITSLTGTANQILVDATSGSPITGNVTLTFDAGISVGSYQATTPPAGGIICPGSMGIGSNLTTAGTFNSTSDLLTLYGTGSASTFTLINANSSAGGLATINLLHDRGSASASGTTLGYIGFGGATDASHTFKLGGATIRSVATEAWSGSANGCYISFHTTPNTTTTLTEAVRINQNASVNIGASFIGAAGIANGLLVQTHVGIAIASPATYAMLHAAADSTTAYIGNFTGTLTVTDTAATSGSMRGISMSPTFNPSSNPAAGSLAASFYSFPVFNAAGGTLDKFYVYYANHSLSSNSATITDLYGFLYDGGTNYSGTATNVYGGYYKIPAGGSNKHALHADNLSIGTYVGSSVPANGNVIISGSVSIGSSTVNSAFNVGSSNQFQVNSSGFLRLGGAPSGTIQFLMNQIFTATSGALAALQIQSPMGASSGTVAEVDAVFLYTDLSVNAGTTTLATSLNIGGGVTGGTVTTGVGINVNALAFGTNRYGVKVTTPSGGTVAIATYTDNLVIGSSYVTSNPPANGSITQGSALFISKIAVGDTTTSQQIAISSTIPNTSQPNGLNNGAADGHTGMMIGNLGNGTNSSGKIGIQFGGYQLYSIGGIFGSNTSNGNNTAGDITIDLRAVDSDTSLTEIFRVKSNGNFGFNGTSSTSYGGGTGVIFIANRSAAPTSNPVNGIFVYANSGGGTCRGSGGTITTFGPAEPHCPCCGSDFGMEWDNDTYGGNLQVCIKCLVADLAGKKEYIRWNSRRLN